MLQEKSGIPASGFSGIMIGGSNYSSGKIPCITWQEAEVAMQKSAVYAWAYKSAVNTKESSSLLALIPPFDVFSDQAKGLVDQGREVVSNFQKHGYEAWTAVTYHPMAIEVDAEELVAGRFPWVVALTALVVFCIIGLRYGAALVPLKFFAQLLCQSSLSSVLVYLSSKMVI
jgi:hypothetical protein